VDQQVNPQFGGINVTVRFVLLDMDLVLEAMIVLLGIQVLRVIVVAEIYRHVLEIQGFLFAGILLVAVAEILLQEQALEQTSMVMVAKAGYIVATQLYQVAA
jgi:hypothetical protein